MSVQIFKKYRGRVATEPHENIEKTGDVMTLTLSGMDLDAALSAINARRRYQRDLDVIHNELMSAMETDALSRYFKRT